MPLLALLLALAGLGLVATSAPAAGERGTLRVTTSLGPREEGTDTRELRARGRAPKGSRLEVRFYRGSRRIGTARPKLRRGRRYRSGIPISRTGVYKAKVIATTRDDQRVVVAAKLRYTAAAEAPAAPDDTRG